MELLKELIAATALILILAGTVSCFSAVSKSSDNNRIAIEKLIREQNVNTEKNTENEIN